MTLHRPLSSGKPLSMVILLVLHALQGITVSGWKVPFLLDCAVDLSKGYCRHRFEIYLLYTASRFAKQGRTWVRY